LRRALALLGFVALFAAGCASTPPSAPAAKAEPGKRPSYYSTDGPPDRVPDNLASIPDALPTNEPYHRFANRPYTVFGRTYVPVVNNAPTRERGMASWYGKKFHGQKTASGEVYDMFTMTAAHKTFPIPSFARVTNVRDGRSVIVRVNDRGPFLEERVIDLSFAAATRLGIAGPGSGLVEVERVFVGAGAPTVAANPRAAPPDAGAVATPLSTTPPPSTPFSTTPLASTPPIVASAIAPIPAPVTRPGAVETPVVAPEAGGLWLQLGAFSSADNAESFRAHIASRLTWLLEPIAISAQGGLHRVRLGPYRQREEAQAIADKVRESLGIAPVLSPR
jgi:rare lipoprotein A